MDLYRFVLGIVLGLYTGFPRLNQLRFIARLQQPNSTILYHLMVMLKTKLRRRFWVGGIPEVARTIFMSPCRGLVCGDDRFIYECPTAI
jgi:hypothetical protein